jgi:hypothetical protein
MKTKRIRSIGSVTAIIVILVLLNAFQYVTSARDSLPRYMIIENQLVFERDDKLPYEILQPMCWDDQLGWCDEGMEEAGYRLVYLIDFDTHLHGVVMQNSTGCWIWWFRPEYGADNNPHIAEHYWITCPDPEQLVVISRG